MVRESVRSAFLTCVAIALLGSAACSSSTPAPAEPARAYRVLVFTKAIVYYHASIPAGAQAIRELGEQGDFNVDVTDDASIFDDAKLEPYAATVFLSTTVENDVLLPTGKPSTPEKQAGSIMNADQKGAFERYIRKGRGYVGIHAASDGDYKWDFYVGLVGAMLRTHAFNMPLMDVALLRVDDQAHPATAGLGATWMRTDEWYNFDPGLRKKLHVLLTLDESSNYQGQPRMNGDHPVAWCQEYAGGRSFYTALGHNIESFAEPLFRKHLAGAIAWAAGKAPGNCAHP